MWIDDLVLSEADQDLSLKFWVPSDTVVVLGRSNEASREVNLEACGKDGVAVLKRMGGGGTVVLHEGCVVLSAGLWVRDHYRNDLYFRLLNQSIIDCVEEAIGGQGLSQRGFSDIVRGDRKLVGTSLFRSRNYLLYQASLLVDTHIEKIEHYLQHPSKEPDYRRGRTHRDFVEGLGGLSDKSPEAWVLVFAQTWQKHLRERMAAELLAAQLSQVPHIKGRIGEIMPLEWDT